MKDADDMNISADLARVLMNKRDEGILKLDPKFSIIGVQIALEDTSINKADIVNKDAVLGLMAGMIESSAKHFGLVNEHNNVLKEIQKAAVIIAKDPNNVRLTQNEAINKGKELIDKNKHNFFPKNKKVVSGLANKLIIASGIKNQVFEKIVTPELKKKLHNAINKDVKELQNTPQFTLVPNKSGKTR